MHLMGTASGQFDIWYGVVWGTRTALFAGLVVTFTTVTVGLIVGSISAFYGGLVDDVLMRITEIFMAFPFLLAALMLSSLLVPKFGRSIWPPTIALIVFGWMRYARVVRGDILSAKERDYILAGRVLGTKDTRLIMRHILPNVIYPILVLASFRLGDAVLSFAALSFLGVGTQIGYADWGQIISFRPGLDPEPGHALVYHHLPRRGADRFWSGLEPDRRCPARYPGSEDAHRTELTRWRLPSRTFRRGVSA